MSEALKIGSFSAFYGDRRNAITQFRHEDVDVLVGDYLAELTMLVLRKNVLRGKAGYATGVVDTLADELHWIAERGITVVVNAGGLDPVGCAHALEEVIAERGLSLTVAAVTGDDLLLELDGLRAAGEEFTNIDTGEPLPVTTDQVLAANAYLGCWPMVEALQAGADIVVAGRVTDAALVMAPAAWRFGWARTAWDELAGAVVAGHAIECGAQVTGGNFCFFDRYDDLGVPGMPIAEIRRDGSCVVTKPADTGGIVTVDTVIAQLLYEVGGPEYHNPDVVADWSAVQVEQLGPDRVLVNGVRGLSPTPSTKVSLSYEGGFRSSMTLGLTGHDIGRKAAWFRRQFGEHVRDPAEFDEIRFSLVGPHADTERAGPASYEEATAWLTVSARSADRTLVDRRRFSDPIVELGVSTFPGCYFTTPPATERRIGVQWPCLVSKSQIITSMHIGSTGREVGWGPFDEAGRPPGPTGIADRDAPATPGSVAPEAETVLAPLGSVFGARSGDKAGTANLGVWAPDDVAYEWLTGWLTVSRLRTLIPEARELDVTRYAFPGIRGLNFVLGGFLGEGTSACLRIDTQAKGLGEYLRAQLAPLPRRMLTDDADVDGAALAHSMARADS